MDQHLAEKPRTKRFTPVGVIFGTLGLLLFAYFVRKAGVGEIMAGIRRLGAAFSIILAISAVRQTVRSLSWMKCFEEPHSLRFRDAFCARVMGDALGTILPFASVVLAEPSKPMFVRGRVPLVAGFSAITIENIFYTLSVTAFIFLGMVALLLNFALPKAFTIASSITIVVVLALIAFIFIVIRKRSKFVSGALDFLYRRGLARRWLETGRERVSGVEDRVYGFYERHPSRFLPILLLDACFHAAGVAEVYVTLAFISAGARPTLLTAFILESVNRIINVVFKFIPLRTGVDEAGTGMLSNILGFTTATGVTLAIIRKARDIFWAAVGFALIMRRGLTLQAAAQETETAVAKEVVASTQ
jgi:hypothetical protein